MNKQDIRSLTGLRGVAAAWVVIYHVFQTDSFAGPLGIALRHGYLAVDIFFVLSGFVIAMSYGHLFKDGYKANYQVFLLRRLARIYPLYLAVTGFVALISFAGLSHTWPASWLSLFENLAMIQAWGLGDNVVPAAWSISVEWALYLLFPLLARAILLQRWQVAGPVCLIAAMIIPALAYHTFPQREEADRLLDICWPDTVYPFLRGLSEFSLGIMVFRLSAMLHAGRSAWPLPPPGGGQLQVPWPSASWPSALPCHALTSCSSRPFRP